jgi:hypothetical protein
MSFSYYKTQVQDRRPFEYQYQFTNWKNEKVTSDWKVDLGVLSPVSFAFKLTDRILEAHVFGVFQDTALYKIIERDKTDYILINHETQECTTTWPYDKDQIYELLLISQTFGASKATDPLRAFFTSHMPKGTNVYTIDGLNAKNVGRGRRELEVRGHKISFVA